MQNLYNYSLELLELNSSRLAEPAWQASVEWGLVAELAEYTEAKLSFELFDGTLESVVKEAGDVLAFVVLVLAKGLLDRCSYESDLRVLAQQVDLIYHENYGYSVDSDSAVRELSSHYFRKYNRQNYSVPVVCIVSAMEGILNDLRPHNISLAHIAEVNLQKLKDRANRGKLFEGSGNNR